jgi:RNA polymerase sigma factor (sigma-70 family)
MTNGPLNAAFRCLRRMIGARGTGDLSDGQLLQRFVAQGDEDAFAALVQRHGGMVLAVARRLLADANDAEDAFQATFVVLLRKARTLGRRELVGNWLYGVAYRVALKMRSTAARRHERQRPLEGVSLTAPADTAWPELRPLIDGEVQRLPRKYREAVVLCYLEGRTNEEAARLLRCPLSTLKTRLARARDRLRGRLTQRGLSLSATGLAALLTRHAAPASVPPALADSLRKTAAASITGLTVDTVSPHVLTVAEGVHKAMLVTKVKLLAAALVAVALLSGGAVALVQHAGAAQDANDPPGLAASPEATPDRAVPDRPAEAAKSDLDRYWKDLASTDEIIASRAMLALAATPKETIAFLKEHLHPVSADPKRVARFLEDLDSKEFPTRVKAEEELEYLWKHARAQLRKALTEGPSAEKRQRIEKILKRLPNDPIDEIEDLVAELRKDPNSQVIRRKLINLLSGRSAPNGAYSVPAPVLAPPAPAPELEGWNAQLPAPAQPKKSAPAVVTEMAPGFVAMPGPQLVAPSPPPSWVRAKRAIVVLEHLATPEARELLKSLSGGEADALPTKEAKAALERLAKGK